MFDYGAWPVPADLLFQAVQAIYVLGHLTLFNPACIVVVPFAIVIGAALPRRAFTPWGLFALWTILTLTRFDDVRGNDMLMLLLTLAHALFVLVLYSGGILLVWLFRPRSNIPFFSGPR